MVDLEYWKEKALECGFSHVGELDVDTIELRKEHPGGMRREDPPL